MQTLDTLHIASVTELREPMKVLEAAQGQPVAILKNNQHLATLVPGPAAPHSDLTHSDLRYATKDEISSLLKKRRELDAPVLSYLQNK